MIKSTTLFMIKNMTDLLSQGHFSEELERKRHETSVRLSHPSSQQHSLDKTTFS